MAVNETQERSEINPDIAQTKLIELSSQQLGLEGLIADLENLTSLPPEDVDTPIHDSLKSSRSLAVQSSEIAAEYADILKRPEVAPVIGEFLQTFSALNSFEGVGFGIINASRVPTLISVYVFQSRNKSSQDSRREKREAYGRFDREIRRKFSSLTVAVNYVNTDTLEGMDIDEISNTLLEEIDNPDNPINSSGLSKEDGAVFSKFEVFLREL